MPSNPGKLAVLASIGLLRDRFFALLKLAPSSVKVSSMTKSFSWKALAWIPFLAVLSCGTSVNESGSTKIDFVMNAPNPNHVLTIQRACERDGTLFVLARVQVRDPNAMAASVITELSDAVVVPGHFEDVERYLVGKTWSWHDSPVVKGYARRQTPSALRRGVEAGEPQIRASARNPVELFAGFNDHEGRRARL